MTRFGLLVGLLAVVLLRISIQPALAGNAVVGNGTAGSCTEAAFDTAFATVQNGGGVLTFNCGGPATITFTDQKIVQAATTIDGGGQITLSGGDQTRLFFVNTGLSLALDGLTLRDGFADVGGGLIEIFGGEVSIVDSRLIDSEATTDGGAINCSKDVTGSVAVTGSELSGHTAKKGGAIYSGGCDVVLTDSDLANNTATKVNAGEGLGGAVLMGAPGALQVTGTTLDGSQAFDGGAIYIETGATATLNDATFTGNEAEYGAGIELFGTADIDGALFEGNTAGVAGGGIWNANGSLTVTQSTFHDNSAGIGGAIVAYGPTTFLTYVTIDGNRATQQGGGGIYIAGAGNTTILSSTISGNTAAGLQGWGGGIYLSGNLALANSTLSGNRAPDAEGGGLHVAGGEALVTYVTLAGNEALDGSQIYYDHIASGPGPKLFGTALDGSPTSCGGKAFTSFGYNLAAAACPSLSQTGDQTSLGTLKLKPLADNGGAGGTMTRLPAIDSPLFDAIPTAACHPAYTDDQRLVARPQGSACDAGAVERQPSDIKPQDVVVGDGSPASCTESAFESALATAQTLGNQTVTFNCGTATIPLTTAKTIYAKVRLDGGDKITLSGGGTTSHFYLTPPLMRQAASGGDLTLENIVLSDGFSFVDGGSIENRGALTLRGVTIRDSKTDPTYAGGAIANYGVLTIEQSVFEDNEAGNGGALYLVDANGSALISDTVFRGNKASGEVTTGYGGAIILRNDAQAGIVRTRLEGNEAVAGGAIYATDPGTAIMMVDHSVVSGNSATAGHGGIVSYGNLTLGETTISNNTGGGVDNHGSTRITHTTFSDNTASLGAGMINRGTAELLNVTFSGNEALTGAGYLNYNKSTLTYVTFSGNQAATAAALYHYGEFPAQTLTVQNVVFDRAGGGPNCATGTITITPIASLGHNLSSDDTCGLNQPTDRQNTDPRLGPLAGNGGATLTHLPAEDSPAVDGGFCIAEITNDQRLVSRPQGEACDIGAVEREPGDGTWRLLLPVVVR